MRVRIGKGGEYSELELGLLILVDNELPETDHDFRVDIVVTPDGVIRIGARRRPGVIWEHVDDETIPAIPVLTARRGH
jgi:5-formyltetrahydrofolate cyclo-ligase